MTWGVETTPIFERDLKRLARRYRSIRQDLEPLIRQLKEGQTPGTQVAGIGYRAYKVRVKKQRCQAGQKRRLSGGLLLGVV